MRSPRVRKLLAPSGCLIISFLTAIPVSIGFILFLFWQGRAVQQQLAVRCIHRLGGWAFYDSRYDKDGNLVAWWPRGPRWAIRLAGVDYFATVNGVVLGTCRPVEGLPDFGLIDQNIPVRDDHLVCLANLSHLQWLVLAETQITDHGLHHLRNLQELRWLWLSRTAISDAGLQHLAGLRNLEKLWLDYTKITGTGFRFWNTLTRLRELSFQGTEVNDDSLRYLIPLRNLQRVNLRDTRCSFRGIVQVFSQAQGRSLKEALLLTELGRSDSSGRIVSVDLSGLQVTDDDLSYLTAFKHLKWLYLRDNPITDLGVELLRELPELTLLDLSGTNLTEAGIRKAITLPRLEILHAHGLAVSEQSLKEALQRTQKPVRLYIQPGPGPDTPKE